MTVSAAGDGDAGFGEAGLEQGLDAGDELTAAHAELEPSFGADAELSRAVEDRRGPVDPAIGEVPDPAIAEVTVTVTELDAAEAPLAHHEVTVSNQTEEPIEHVVVLLPDDVALVDDVAAAALAPDEPSDSTEVANTEVTETDVTGTDVMNTEPGRFEIPLVPGAESITFVVAGTDRALSGDDGPLVAEIAGFQRPSDEPAVEQPETNDAQADGADAPDGDPSLSEGDVDLASGDPTYSIGDLVWLDADDDGKIGADETPLAIVRLELFADANADGIADDTDADGSITSNDALAVTTSGSDGTYAFTGLDAGEYVVGIPPSEWGAGRSLVGLLSSTPVPIGSLRNVDDIGDVCACGYVMSGGIAVGMGGSGDASGALDPSEDLSVDFGFWRPALDLGIALAPAEGTPSQPSPGSIVTFVISVENLGNVTATDIEVLGSLSDSMSLEDDGWQVQADGSLLATITGASLLPGETTTITLRARLSASASGSLIGQVAVADASAVDADGFALRLPPGELLVLTPSPATAEAAIVVAQGAPAPTLPETGTTSGLLASAGLALLLLGIAIVTLSSRVLVPSMAPCSDEHAIGQ